MSYDITTRPDEKFSRSVPREPLAAFIAQLPLIRRADEPQFVLDEKPKRWVEISLETVDEVGNCVDEDGKIRRVRTASGCTFLTPSSAMGRSMTITRRALQLPTTSAGRCMTSRAARTFRETLSLRTPHSHRSLGDDGGVSNHAVSET